MISLIFAFNFFIGFVGFYTLLWYFLADHKFKGPNFVFRAEELHDISKLGIGKSSKEEMFETVHQELLKRFPNHVWKQRKWIFFNAGGWMGHLCVLHASLTEYVILFGSPLPTSGHSGRYPLEVFDFVMEGEYHNQYELTIDSHSYKPGDASYLPCMKSCTFCIKDHAWMLEYGRGLLPLSLPFQSVGSLFTTLDYISMFRLQMTFAKYLLYELIFNQKI